MIINDYNNEIEIKKIEEIKQNIKDHYYEYNVEKNTSLFLFIISLPASFMALSKGLMNVFLLNNLISTICLVCFDENNRKLKELKKYKLYLSMKDDLEKEENEDILDVIEKEKIYQIPLDINSISKYSYYDIKLLKKELDRRNLNK